MNAPKSEQNSIQTGDEFSTKDNNYKPTADMFIINSKKSRGRKPKNTAQHTHAKIVETYTSNDQKTVDIQLKTFHFNFSEEITSRFTYFATLHKYDDRKQFKESWKAWIQEGDIAEAISKEMVRLEQEGYSGDILDKMFKSVRYYYRKKPAVPTPPIKRKSYVSLDLKVLERMDQHIIRTIVQHTESETKTCVISPAKSFDLYIKSLEIEDQVEPIAESQGFPDSVEHSKSEMFRRDKASYENEIEKHKKTYKNRFFIATRNIRTIC